jgi:DMSO/TMAO reductase YedYZ heme-binding membrane subunit
MPYQKWFKKTVEKTSQTETDFNRYIHVLTLGLVIFGIFYLYLFWQGSLNILNKAIADASVILIGLSMLLTAICYFWDFADTKIIYRKHLGLVGFAFALTHVVLSQQSLFLLLDQSMWRSAAIKPVVAGLTATIIFTIMAVISNNIATKKLGGVGWRRILRTGYAALFFVLVHVAFLKAQYWINWWQSGLNRPPALSLVVTIFIGVVLLSRVLLWISLLIKKAKTKVIS